MKKNLAKTECLRDGTLHTMVNQDLVKYDVANTRMMARFNSDLNIERYVTTEGCYVLSTCDEPKILQEPLGDRGKWRTELSIDGQRLGKRSGKKKVYARGRIFRVLESIADIDLEIICYCDNKTNVLFQLYRFKNSANTKHDVNVKLHMEFDLRVRKREDAVKSSVRKIKLTRDRDTQALIAKSSEGVAAILGATIPMENCIFSRNQADVIYKIALMPHSKKEFCIALTGGQNLEIEKEIFKIAISGWEKFYQKAQDYSGWISSRFSSSSAILNSVFTACLNASLSSYRETDNKKFRGFSAGSSRYCHPLRTYFRDAYWTVQSILPFEPELVKEEILTLAQGVHDDGQCPSAVLSEEGRDIAEGIKLYPEDWWSDHYDSPSYFVMMVYDYLAWTGDFNILKEELSGISIWEKAKLCIQYLQSKDEDKDYLFEKPYSLRDWGDCVYRSELVTYDLVLYYRAIICIAELSELLGKPFLSEKYTTLAQKVRKSINKKMWDENLGYYVNYKRRGRDENQPAEIRDCRGPVKNSIRLREDFVEDHLAIETLLTILYNVADERQSSLILENVEKRLESRNNLQQPYGDWGMLSCYPLYKNKQDLIGPSSLDYSYHNGAEWPYLDAIYALLKLIKRENGWDYPLIRWWTYSVEQNWLTPIEYYSPIYGRGALLQGWSSMPAAVIIMGGFGLYPNLRGEMKLSVPPWGNSELKGIKFRGDEYDFIVKNGKMSMAKNGQRIPLESFEMASKEDV